MKYLFLALLLLLGTPALADGVYVSPYSDCHGEVVSLINDSKTSIRMAAFAINDPDIVNALISAKSRGVDVQIICDHSQSSMTKERKSLAALSAASIPVFIGKSLKHQLMHAKFLISDDNTVEEGSYNYTVQAQEQDNTVCIITNFTVSAIFKFYWEKIKADLR